MNRSLQIRGLVSLVVVLASLIMLWPTFRALSISDTERQAAQSDPQRKERLDAIDAKAIRRGLDLQGGMYLVLEIDKGEMSDEQATDALGRVREIISNRVDQFGVSEPVIQTVGTTRIIVQLPGLQDPERAKDLIGRTARLEFRLVRTADDYQAAIQKLDEALRSSASAPAATPAAPAPGDTTSNPYGELPDVAQDAATDAGAAAIPDAVLRQAVHDPGSAAQRRPRVLRGGRRAGRRGDARLRAGARAARHGVPVRHGYGHAG